MSRPDKIPVDLGDLTPGNGLSDYSISVAGLDNLGHGTAAIRFKLFTKQDGNEQTVATLAFKVGPGHDGMEGMVARAHDDLIAALRQMLFQAALARHEYKKRGALYAAMKAKAKS